MGFFESLGEMIGEDIKYKKNKYDSAARSSVNKSDERLIHDYQRETDIWKKGAMAKELKSRGYGTKD